ncbi:hypothetical protein HY501_01150 [Candidatus Woesearchaeota archaeon]|nr:hypothetical protein [Candidatus Woesearchaeota archaeon]
MENDLDSLSGLSKYLCVKKELSFTPSMDDLGWFHFVGYDRSGTTRDPKGVLKLRKQDPTESLIYRYMEPETMEVGRGEFECILAGIEKRIHQIRDSWDYQYLINSEEELELRRLQERAVKMQGILKEVEDSRETPTYYRELRGLFQTTLNGVEASVETAWVQIQLSGSPPYFLKGNEFVIDCNGRKILARRYFNDPRVVVEGTFEGDVRSPRNFSREVAADIKPDLVRFLGSYHPGIEEIFFCDDSKIKVS